MHPSLPLALVFLWMPPCMPLLLTVVPTLVYMLAQRRCLQLSRLKLLVSITRLKASLGITPV